MPLTGEKGTLWFFYVGRLPNNIVAPLIFAQKVYYLL